MALPQQWRAKPFWVEGAGHNNIEALLRPTGTFVDKVVEFLDLHITGKLSQKMILVKQLVVMFIRLL